MIEDNNATVLLNAILKFQSWNREYESTKEHFKEEYAVAKLMNLLDVDPDRIMLLIGGGNAPVFRYAVNEIETLRSRVAELEKFVVAIRGWDCLDVYQDGMFWKSEIEKLLNKE